MRRKRIKPAKGWAIAGEIGIYTGWWFRKVEAIAEHVNIKNGWIEWPLHSSKLTDEQKAAWRVCQKNGDVAIKVRISAL